MEANGMEQAVKVMVVVLVGGIMFSFVGVGYYYNYFPESVSMRCGSALEPAEARSIICSVR